MMNQIRHMIDQFFGEAHSSDQCCDTLTHAGRDWTLLGGVAVVLFVVFVAFDLWMYVSVGNISTSSSAAPVAVSTGPSVAELNGVLSAYAAYAGEYKQLLAAPPQVADPAK